MKNKIYIIILTLLFSIMLSGFVSASNVKTIIFNEDFESYDVGETDINNFYNESFTTLKINEHDNNKHLEAFAATDSENWSVFFINDLEDYLDRGEEYELSMNLLLENIDEFYLHYIGSWASDPITFNPNGGASLPENHPYYNNVTWDGLNLSLEFITSNEYEGGDWGQFAVIFKHHMDASVYVDNIKIEEVDSVIIDDEDDNLFFENFESYDVNETDIDNIYNVSFSEILIAEHEGNNYLLLNKTNVTETVWTEFYVNELESHLERNQEYTLKVDLKLNNVLEFYLHYIGGWASDPITFNPNGGATLPENKPYYEDVNWDGTSLSLTFLTSDTYPGSDWGQFFFVFKHDTDITVAVDNIKIFVPEVEVDVVEGLSIDSSKVMKYYKLGTELNLSELLIFTKYTSGLKVDVTDAAIIDSSAYNKNEPGTYQIDISYGDFESSFKVTVLEDTEDLIEVYRNPLDENYTKTITNDENGKFDSITLKYDPENNPYLEFKKDATSDTWSNFFINHINDDYPTLINGLEYELSFDMFADNIDEFYIHYIGNWVTYDVRYALDGSTYLPEIHGRPGYQDLITYQSASFDGITVKLNFIANNVIYDGDDWAQLQIIFKHNKNLTILANNFSIKEVSKPLSLEIDADNVKTNYFEGEEFESTGLFVEAVFENGIKKNVSDLVTIDYSNFDFVAGKYDILVSYSGVSKDYEVTVIEDSLSSIALDTSLVKTTYHLGETLNLDNLLVTATYLSGKVIDVSADVTINSESFNNDEPNSYQITVNYDGQTANFTVLVEGTLPPSFGELLADIDETDISKNYELLLELKDIYDANHESLDSELVDTYLEYVSQYNNFVADKHEILNKALLTGEAITKTVDITSTMANVSLTLLSALSNIAIILRRFLGL